MDTTLILILSLIGAFGAFISGLVGIGGAIVIYPMVLFIPPLFGYEISPGIASGLTAAQVFFSTMSGSLSQRGNPDLNKNIILPMGTGILLGSLLGAYSATIFDESLINIVYTFLAILAVFLMFVKVKPENERTKFNKTTLFITALVIGILSGIVGAGGAFIILPVLLAIFKAPFRSVVASSIVIAFISSVGTFIMKSMTGQIDFMMMLSLVIASLLFAPIGTKLSKKTNQKILRIILALLIALAAIKMIMNMI
ncbi:sulfite exporter TauE/SafE family protein [Macrococcus armenti]|uniref:sulfite exporter TauE/SafE family protein n=1 Tax=Macrococcus armenti TaxID=2875764 RepID=UPI001CC97023|nr:sulfite exporter TauE/SafE family protein [Macrococcus armenti]UBH15834.1 sulfite exporter TauE/SafE family protein [Macrococcus armenti]UBH18194.1 sulfite exporter TauE/SafE family protein [Macrococcus armenti]UBH20460.1 sulfite exporter TauE/SafE family protein [Macrococcus armenti]